MVQADDQSPFEAQVKKRRKNSKARGEKSDLSISWWRIAFQTRALAPDIAASHVVKHSFALESELLMTTSFMGSAILRNPQLGDACTETQNACTK